MNQAAYIFWLISTVIIIDLGLLLTPGIMARKGHNPRNGLWLGALLGLLSSVLGIVFFVMVFDSIIQITDLSIGVETEDGLALVIEGPATAFGEESSIADDLEIGASLQFGIPFDVNFSVEDARSYELEFIRAILVGVVNFMGAGLVFNIVWRLIPAKSYADETGVLPEGENLKRNTVARKLRGQILRWHYNLATVVAIIALSALLWNIIKGTFTMTAIADTVDPSVLTRNHEFEGQDLSELDREQLGDIIIADDPDTGQAWISGERLRTLVGDYVLEIDAETARDIRSERLEEVLEDDQIFEDFPDEMTWAELGDDDQPGAVQASIDILGRNLSQDELSTVVYHVLTGMPQLANDFVEDADRQTLAQSVVDEILLARNEEGGLLYPRLAGQLVYEAVAALSDDELQALATETVPDAQLSAETDRAALELAVYNQLVVVPQTVTGESQEVRQESSAALLEDYLGTVLTLDELQQLLQDNFEAFTPATRRILAEKELRTADAERFVEIIGLNDPVRDEQVRNWAIAMLDYTSEGEADLEPLFSEDAIPALAESFVQNASGEDLATVKVIFRQDAIQIEEDVLPLDSLMLDEETTLLDQLVANIIASWDDETLFERAQPFLSSSERVSERLQDPDEMRSLMQRRLTLREAQIENLSNVLIIREALLVNYVSENPEVLRQILSDNFGLLSPATQRILAEKEIRTAGTERFLEIIGYEEGNAENPLYDFLLDPRFSYFDNDLVNDLANSFIRTDDKDILLGEVAGVTLQTILLEDYPQLAADLRAAAILALDDESLRETASDSLPAIQMVPFNQADFDRVLLEDTLLDYLVREPAVSLEGEAQSTARTTRQSLLESYLSETKPEEELRQFLRNNLENLRRNTLIALAESEVEAVGGDRAVLAAIGIDALPETNRMPDLAAEHINDFSDDELKSMAESFLRNSDYDAFLGNDGGSSIDGIVLNEFPELYQDVVQGADAADLSGFALQGAIQNYLGVSAVSAGRELTDEQTAAADALRDDLVNAFDGASDTALRRLARKELYTADTEHFLKDVGGASLDNLEIGIYELGNILADPNYGGLNAAQMRAVVRSEVVDSEPAADATLGDILGNNRTPLGSVERITYQELESNPVVVRRILVENVERDVLETLIEAEIVKPRVVRTWTLDTTVMNQLGIEDTVIAEVLGLQINIDEELVELNESRFELLKTDNPTVVQEMVDEYKANNPEEVDAIIANIEADNPDLSQVEQDALVTAAIEEEIEPQLKAELRFNAAEKEFRSWLSLDLITRTLSAEPELTGMRNAILGSLMVIFFTILVAFPIGVGAAIYLEEYATDNALNRVIQTNIDNLAGVPSIIYGLLGVAIFVRLMEPFTSGSMFGLTDPTTANGRTIISASLTLALLILPIIIINSQEAIRAVQPSIRQASFGLGATKWQTVWNHVLPYAMPGILTGTILAVSRAIGETAPLIVVGAATFIVSDPSGPFSKFTALPIQIYNWTKWPEDSGKAVAAAGIIILLLLLLSLNSFAILLRNRFERNLS